MVLFSRFQPTPLSALRHPPRQDSSTSLSVLQGLCFFSYTIYCVCMHACKWSMCVCLSAPQHASGGQRTILAFHLNSVTRLGQVPCLLSRPTSLETPFMQASITICHYLSVPKAKHHCCSSRQQRPQPPSSTCQTHLGSPSSPWLSSSSSLPLYSYSVSSAKETTDTFPLTAPASTLGRETSAGNICLHSPALQLQVQERVPWAGRLR